LIVIGFVGRLVVSDTPKRSFPVKNTDFSGAAPRKSGGLSRPSPPKNEEEIYHAIATGQLNLVDVRNAGSAKAYASGQKDIVGTFCPLAFEKHTADPSKLPMFRDLVSASPLCKSGGWKVQANIGEAVRRIREYDKTSAATDLQQEMYPPSGFVFHESRCGSTLAANSLAAAGAHVRVYSESAPPIGVLSGCVSAGDRCDRDAAATLLRDVVLLMSRVREDGGRTRRRSLFFKIQSIGSHSVDVVTRAFPTTPWIFVYRDPTPVMMSHISNGKGDASRTNCARGRNRFHMYPQISKLMIEDGKENGDGNPTDVRKLTAEDYCAVHLAALCRSAIAERLRQGQGLGRFANYNNLVKDLVTDFFPNHFKLELTKDMEDNIYKVTKNYSKGRAGSRAGEFKDDSKKKESAASQVVKNAAERYMMPSFEAMEEFAILDKR